MISQMNASFEIDISELEDRVNQINISVTGRVESLELAVQALQFQNAELRALLDAMNQSSGRNDIELLALRKLSFKPDINEFMAKNCLDLKLASVSPAISSDKAKQDLAEDLLEEAVDRKEEAKDKLTAALGIADKAIKSGSMSAQSLAKLNNFVSGALSDISNITTDLNNTRSHLNNISSFNMSSQASAIQAVTDTLGGEVSVLNSAQSAIASGNFTSAKSLLESALATEAVIKQDIESVKKAVKNTNIGQTIQNSIKLECAKAFPRPDGKGIKLPLGVQFEVLSLQEQQALEQKVRDIEDAFLQSFIR